MLKLFEKFDEDKARRKVIQGEIGRKKQLSMMMASGSQTNPSVEGFSSNLSTHVRDPLRYVPSTHEIWPKKKKNIQSYFTPSSTSTSASQLSETQPTLENYWKKQYKESTFEYIVRWWYDACYPPSCTRTNLQLNRQRLNKKLLKN
jgi:hypothetical protein